MNIFVLSEDPEECARFHSDKHVARMFTEACLMLDNAFYKRSSVSKEEIPYELSFINHPCSQWTLESRENFEWLLRLAIALDEEYTLRWLYKDRERAIHRKRNPDRVVERHHKCHEALEWIKANKHKLTFPKVGRTPFYVAIDEKKFPGCKFPGFPVKSYRLYHKLYKQGYVYHYKVGRKHKEVFVKYNWTLRPRPDYMD